MSEHLQVVPVADPEEMAAIAAAIACYAAEAEGPKGATPAAVNVWLRTARLEAVGLPARRDRPTRGWRV